MTILTITVLTITGDILIIAGALVFATAALGILRFPDAYTRLSAVGTAAGIGIILVVTGALLYQPSVFATFKVILIVALQLATSAVGSIAIARSAFLTQTPLYRLNYNDLADSSSTSSVDATPTRDPSSRSGGRTPRS